MRDGASLAANSAVLQMLCMMDASRVMPWRRLMLSLAHGKEVGIALAKACKEKNINSVIFDRNGFLYHGRVKAVADGAREGGLDF